MSAIIKCYIPVKKWLVVTSGVTRTVASGDDVETTKKNPGLRILKQPSKSLLNLLYYYVPISKEERKVVFDITIILE